MGSSTPIIVLAIALAGCHGQQARDLKGEQPATPARAAASPTPGDARPLVVFLGDSLTSGFDLDEDEAYPALVGRKLRERGLGVRVLNAGVSGDTTEAGLERLDGLLAQDPDVLVVALGANDGHRGLPLAAVEANLRTIVTRAKDSGARVLLAGIGLPMNDGAEYRDAFAALFPRLARELDVALLPVLLAGVAGNRELNLADGIHPNQAGHRVMAETVTAAVHPIVAAASAARER